MVDMVDNYYNLTLKSMHMLKFFNEPQNFDGQSPSVLIKVDDDVFLNLPLLTKQLRGETFTSGKIKTNISSKWIMGHILKSGKIPVIPIPLDKMNQVLQLNKSVKKEKI